MRHSSLRHPVAVLRVFLKLYQPEFAELVGCSSSTVKAIECGPKRMRLSTEMAMLIAEKTGVSPQWLMAGDPLAPMTAIDGSAYEKLAPGEPAQLGEFEDIQRSLSLLFTKAKETGNAWRAKFLVTTALKDIEENILSVATPTHGHL